ncbi:MAG: type II toxin-antitoxin system RelE/ParE family toxin [Acidobacteriaceae bacterium]|nr:type II toxin-antitoxin system RelE/ParE family toxin [Acidobacteriaceae bacterium]
MVARWTCNVAAMRAHIGKENPAAAIRVAVQIVVACDRLEYLPERGRPGLVAGTRELVALWRYVIVYRITLAAVEIINIWHGAQDR